MNSRPFESLRAAYEGVEAEFADREQLERYRQTLVEKSEPQVRFIESRASRCGAAVEVACGNGRLLLALKQRGAIGRGVGMDLADSRIEFARRWASELGVDALRFMTGDALDFSADEPFNLALCVTGAFGYFDAHVPGSSVRLLDRLSAALHPNGALILELYQQSSAIQHLEATGADRLRVWHELPPTDPWRFYLSELWLDGRVIVHEKTFVHRTNGRIDTGRSERMAFFSPEELQAMLVGAGFAEVSLFEGWTDAPYAGGDVMVVHACRDDAAQHRGW